MDRNLFFLVFVPGLTVSAVVIGFLFSVLALRQGEMQKGTKRGLLSLALTLVLLAALFLIAFRFDHLELHAG